MLKDEEVTVSMLVAKDDEIERLRTALANLVYRLDCHFGAGSGDWKEQEEARAALSVKDTGQTDG